MSLSKLPCTPVAPGIRICDPCLPPGGLPAIPEPSGSRLSAEVSTAIPSSAEVGQHIPSSHSLAPPHTYTHRNTLCLCHCSQAGLADIQLKLPALRTEPPWTLKTIPLLNRAIRGRLKIHVLLSSRQIRRISGLASSSFLLSPTEKKMRGPPRVHGLF